MTRIAAAAGPALMLLYGVLRWLDGADGTRKNGWEWDVGHVAFFAAIVLFGVLAVELARSLRGRVAWAAAAATLAGAACFLWVITGDLSESFQNAAPLPGPLEIAGPLLFQAGLLTLLGLSVARRGLPAWSPVLVLLGFVCIPVSLDLLPLAAVLVGAGLYPFAQARPLSRAAVPGR